MKKDRRFSDSKVKALLRVQDLAEKHPGITITELAKKMRVPSRTIHDYVRELQQDDKLESVKVWRQRHLSLPGQMPSALSGREEVYEPEVDVEEPSQFQSLRSDEDQPLGYDDLEEAPEPPSLSPRAAMLRVLEIKEEQRKLLSRAGILDDYMALDDEARELVKAMPTS